MEAIKNKKYSVIFRCTVPKCSYSSKRLYNLQRHVKTHGKEHWRSKRFPCPCCAYAAATRAHLKRHMGNKHPTEDIDKYHINVLAYEDFESGQDHTRMDSAEEEDPPQEQLLNDQEPLEEDTTELIEGPVTVLQLVTPSTQQTKANSGERYFYVTLEGEASRLVPVDLLPSDTINEDL